MFLLSHVLLLGTIRYTMIFVNMKRAGGLVIKEDMPFLVVVDDYTCVVV